MTTLSTIKDVRRLYDMRSILGMQSNKRVIVCPLPQHPHNNYSPSFSIFTSPEGVQLFRCHGACGLQGDVIDLVGYMKVTGYNPKDGEHVKQAAGLLGASFKIEPPVKIKSPPMLTNDVFKRHLPVGEKALKYAMTRGLKRETLEYFGVGQFDTPSTEWMTIPTITGAQLTMLKLRQLNPCHPKDRYRNYPGSVSGMFNVNAVRSYTGPILIVKAEIVTMLLHQYGIISCAPNTGEGNVEERWYQDVMFTSRRIVVGDNDPDPKIREKIMLATRKRAEVFRADLKLPPDNYKDLDEFILAEPQVAIPLVREWLK